MCRMAMSCDCVLFTWTPPPQIFWNYARGIGHGRICFQVLILFTHTGVEGDMWHGRFEEHCFTCTNVVTGSGVRHKLYNCLILPGSLRSRRLSTSVTHGHELVAQFPWPVNITLQDCCITCQPEYERLQCWDAS